MGKWGAQKLRAQTVWSKSLHALKTLNGVMATCVKPSATMIPPECVLRRAQQPWWRARLSNGVMATCVKPIAILIPPEGVLRQEQHRSAHSARPAISTPSSPGPAQLEAPSTALSAHQHAWLDSLETGRRVPHARHAAALQPLPAHVSRAV